MPIERDPVPNGLYCTIHISGGKFRYGSRLSWLTNKAPGGLQRCLSFGPCMDGSPLARGYLSILQLLVGAAMYPTCRCGLSYAAGHNAIRAAQVPIESSHSKCTAPVGSPDPAVSTGFVH